MTHLWESGRGMAGDAVLTSRSNSKWWGSKLGLRAFVDRGRVRGGAAQRRNGFLVAGALCVTLGGTAARGERYDTTRIPTVPRSIGVAVSEDNRTVFTTSSHNVIGVIDAIHDTFVRGIDLNGIATNPTGIAFSHGMLYIVTFDKILVVDPSGTLPPAEIAQPFIIGQNQGDIASSPDGRRLFAVAGTSTVLTVIDPTMPADEANAGTVTVGRDNTNVSVSPDGNVAYVLNPNLGQLTIVDVQALAVIGTTSFTGGLPLLNLPVDSAVRMDGTLYAAWMDENYRTHFSLLNPDGSLRTILDVPGNSNSIAFSLDESLILTGGGYVLDPDDGSIVGDFSVVVGSSQVSYSSDGVRGYVTNTNGQHLIAVSGFQSSLTMSGTPAMGETVALNLYVPRQHHRRYQLAASRSTMNGTEANGRIFPLDADDLFYFSLQLGQTDPFNGFTGRLDREGRATATIHISDAIPGRTVGDTFYVAFGTFMGERRNPMDADAVSNVVAITIQP